MEPILEKRIKKSLKINTDRNDWIRFNSFKFNTQNCKTFIIQILRNKQQIVIL